MSTPAARPAAATARSVAATGGYTEVTRDQAAAVLAGAGYRAGEIAGTLAWLAEPDPGGHRSALLPAPGLGRITIIPAPGGRYLITRAPARVRGPLCAGHRPEL